MIGGRVLDASALLDLASSRTVYGAAFLAAANDVGIVLALPAAVLQEVWATAAQADLPFVELILGLPGAVVSDLDESAARRSGELAGRPFDAAAAHSVLVSRERGWPVLSADPQRLRTVDPDLAIESLPGVAPVKPDVCHCGMAQASSGYGSTPHEEDHGDGSGGGGRTVD